jgi:hypothetical protein
MASFSSPVPFYHIPSYFWSLYFFVGLLETYSEALFIINNHELFLKYPGIANFPNSQGCSSDPGKNRNVGMVYISTAQSRIIGHICLILVSCFHFLSFCLGEKREELKKLGKSCGRERVCVGERDRENENEEEMKAKRNILLFFSGSGMTIIKTT